MPDWVLYLVRRIAVAAVVLLAVSFGVFSLLYIAPGSVESNVLGDAVRDPQAVAAVRAEYNLDEPFLMQYWLWLGAAVHLDFGTSIRTGEPVVDVLTSSASITMLLIAMAFVITTLAGVPLGVIAALKVNTSLDRAITGFAVVGTSAPTFAIGIFLLYIFGLELGWFPIFGQGEPGLDRLYHLTLPALALALHLMAFVIKITRTAMLDTLNQDYVGFARARGVPRVRVLRRYALRNASIPVLTASGLLIGALVSQIVLVEVTFSLSGLGTLLVQSIEFKDLPVVQAVALVAAAIVVFANLAVDMLYSVVDPRIRLGAARS